METATLGGGCFWCTEAVYKMLKGVESVESGYSGGTVENPTYQQVCDGDTGHAEAIQITFDSNAITYNDVLDVFFETHDPTTLNRQGNDVGTQYRSVIFYHDDNQKIKAEEKLKELNASGKYRSPIVTEIKPFTKFYKAESYHQNYFENNQNAPYCTLVISPKIEKFKHKFENKLKL